MRSPLILPKSFCLHTLRFIAYPCPPPSRLPSLPSPSLSPSFDPVAASPCPPPSRLSSLLSPSLSSLSDPVIVTPEPVAAPTDDALSSPLRAPPHSEHYHRPYPTPTQSAASHLPYHIFLVHPCHLPVLLGVVTSMYGCRSSVKIAVYWICFGSVGTW